MMEIQENNESKETSNVPDEIWIQIRARLPFQTYLTTRTVCKAWKEIIPYDLRFRINVHPAKPLLCGIFVSSFNFRESTSQNDIVLKYISRRSKRIINLRPGNTIDSDFIIRSGYPKGLYSELSFDFSAINQTNRSNEFFYTIGGGLLLITHKDGSSEVRNPVTKQVVTVPKPKFAKTSDRLYYPNERTGIIVQYRSSFCGRCRFLVIRFCRRKKVMEVYDSMTSKWVWYPMKLDELHLFEVHWHIQNYVVVYRGTTTLCLFILTTGGRGIVIKFRSMGVQGYSFPLPKLVRLYNGGVDDDNIKICECRNNLRLMYHNNNGFWIWKADSINADSWTWVPVIEVNQRSRVCRPTRLKQLVEYARDSSGVCRVVTLTCHSNGNVVFLLIETLIFAYHITQDIIELIIDMKDEEDQRISSIMPLYPCLSNIQPLESSENGTVVK